MRTEKEIRDFAGRMRIIYESFVAQGKLNEAVSAGMMRDLLEWALGADNAAGRCASSMEGCDRAHERARRN